MKPIPRLLDLARRLAGCHFLRRATRAASAAAVAAVLIVPILHPPSSILAADAAPAAAPPKDGGPILAEWPLIHRNQRLVVYAAGKFKPYVKELCTLTGVNILRDAPFDHLHHHGLMYAIAANGVNFWEEVAGAGIQKPVETSAWAASPGPEGRPQFVLRQTLHWLAPADASRPDTAAAAILIEHRTLTVTLDEPGQETALQWKSAFEVGGQSNSVALSAVGHPFFGLGMRFLQELDALADHFNADGRPDLSGTRQDLSPHAWEAVAFDRPGAPATIALFCHPSNARHPAVFFSMKRAFAYLSATQALDKQPIVHRAGEKFELNYLVTLYPALKSSDALNARARSWAAAKP